MRRLLAALAVTFAFAATGCAGQPPPEPEPEPVEFFEPPAPTERPEPPADDAYTANATAEGQAIEPPPEPEPEPEPPTTDDGVPSIEEQIQQCIEDTGLPEDCRNKIEFGIVE